MSESLHEEIGLLKRARERERKARERSEELLESKSRELFEANEALVLSQTQMVHSEKMAGLGQIAAGVAHEINNPVGFILSNLGTLEEYVCVIRRFLDAAGKLRAGSEGRNTGQVKEGLEEIEAVHRDEDIEFLLEDLEDLVKESREGAIRVRDIILGLRNFARVDEAELKEADINEGLDSTLKVAWNEIKYKCEVIKEYVDLPPLLCHPAQLNQVFMNIILNGVQAIEEIGEIRIRTETDGESIAVHISDTGSGISPENVRKLFDPFFTTKDVGKGTGLGLSISHGIVEKHNGTIEVDSEVGVGTTVTIRLPLENGLGADE